jgi:hypothetical protein
LDSASLPRVFDPVTKIVIECILAYIFHSHLVDLDVILCFNPPDISSRKLTAGFYGYRLVSELASAFISAARLNRRNGWEFVY